jgi:hypothetical protein
MSDVVKRSVFWVQGTAAEAKSIDATVEVGFYDLLGRLPNR